MSSKDQASGGWLKVAKDVIAGTCGGVSVTLVGHPFDTLKVRLQTQSQAQPLYCEWEHWDMVTNSLTPLAMHGCLIAYTICK